MQQDGDASCLYVLHRDHEGDDVVHVASIFWKIHGRKLYHMRALRTWYDERFVDDLDANQLRDKTERDLWCLSMMDA